MEIGGVEFLSQLRFHCDPSLHPLVDEILEHLLKLPHVLFPSTSPSAPGSSFPPANTSETIALGTLKTTYAINVNLDIAKCLNSEHDEVNLGKHEYSHSLPIYIVQSMIAFRGRELCTYNPMQCFPSFCNTSLVPSCS